MLGVASAVWIVILAWAACVQSSYWSDSETLWNRALACTTRNATAQYNLGVTLWQKNCPGEAIRCFREAIAIQPRGADAQNDLGVLLAQAGKLDEAKLHFQAALAVRPDMVDAHKNLAKTLELEGNVAGAITHWREVVRFQPYNLGAVNQLAWAMATQPADAVRNGAEAVELAQWAVRLSRAADPIPLGTLAAAYAETGRYSDAVQTADRAILLATDRGDAKMADALRRQNQCYRKGTPFRAGH
jgi:tetratricopeptide (TPR) repeat protein